MDTEFNGPAKEPEINGGKGTSWQYVLGIVISLAAAALIGFFGVIASVFTDSMLTERLIMIAVLLLIYFISSGICSFLLPNYGWKWGIIFCAPGVLLLAAYTALEWNPYYLFYLVLIVGFALFGAWTGSSIRKRAAK